MASKPRELRLFYQARSGRSAKLLQEIRQCPEWFEANVEFINVDTPAMAPSWLSGVPCISTHEGHCWVGDDAFTFVRVIINQQRGGGGGENGATGVPQAPGGSSAPSGSDQDIWSPSVPQPKPGPALKGGGGSSSVGMTSIKALQRQDNAAGQGSGGGNNVPPPAMATPGDKITEAEADELVRRYKEPLQQSGKQPRDVPDWLKPKAV